MFAITRRSFLILSFVKRNIPKDFCGIHNLPLTTIKNQVKLLKIQQPAIQIQRFKKDKSKKKEESSSTDTEKDEIDIDNLVDDKHSKVLKIRVNSLRADLLLKASLGMARNKIETLFYESKIRVNGEKLLKKSALINVGDEVDVVKGASVMNPEFLTVARVEILDATEKGDGFSVKIRRCKSLTVENYDK